MVEAKIAAGVCGFTTTVNAICEDGQHVRLKVATDCEKIGALARTLAPVEFDAFEEIKNGFDGELFRQVRATLRGCCAGCAVPAGLFKSLQVAAGLALPRPVHIEINTLPQT